MGKYGYGGAVAEAPETNGRGRPPGVKNGEGVGLAPIVNWTATDEMIVQLSIANWSNGDIAEKYDLTPTRISQILNDPRAKKTKDLIIARIRERAEQNIEDSLVSMVETGVRQLRRTIDYEFDLGTDAKKHQDNVILSLTKPYLAGLEARVTPSAPLEDVSPKLFERMVSALEKGNEAEELHGGAVEADFIVVPSENGHAEK